MRLNTVGVIVMLALSILATPLATNAQPSGKVYRLGVLDLAPKGLNAAYLDAFRHGLRELGYVEEQNLVIEYRWAEGRFERLPDLATELVRLQVDVLFAVGGAAAGAAKRATETIPIVLMAGDPVAQGLVASLARPGGNVTGVSGTIVELSQKRLEIFTEVLSRNARLAVLWCPSSGVGRQQWNATQVAAQALGVPLLPLEVRSTADDFEALFAAATRERVDGLIVLGCNVIPLEITDLARKHRLPAIYSGRVYVANGGLMSYSRSLPAAFRRAAAYVDKILKGATPADLPVELSMKWEFIINLKTAKELGLSIPQTVLFQADEVIQ
jgi:putative ABC transport system substrate-binding protein